jgi:ankyrin repeat protein
MLCSSAVKGNVKRLTSLMKAGADLNQPDVSNRTAFHLAVHHKQVGVHALFCPSSGSNCLIEIYFI